MTDSSTSCAKRKPAPSTFSTGTTSSKPSPKPGTAVGVSSVPRTIYSIRTPSTSSGEPSIASTSRSSVTPSLDGSSWQVSTGRYTGSPESAMEFDLANLREVNNASEFVRVLDRTCDSSLPNDFWSVTLPNELATSSPRSPSLFAYYASLVLLNAQVLCSKQQVADLLDPSVHSPNSAVERHPLFPKNYLKTLLLRRFAIPIRSQTTRWLNGATTPRLPMPLRRSIGRLLRPVCLAPL